MWGEVLVDSICVAKDFTGTLVCEGQAGADGECRKKFDSEIVLRIFVQMRRNFMRFVAVRIPKLQAMNSGMVVKFGLNHN